MKNMRKWLMTSTCGILLSVLLFLPLFSQDNKNALKKQKPAVLVKPKTGNKKTNAPLTPAVKNAPPDAPQNPPDASKTKYKNVGLKADHMRFNNKTKNLLAEDNVVLTTEDMKIVCEKLLYNTEAETAKITGNPVFTQPGTQITGDVLSANFKEKKLHIEGNVQVVQEKKAIKKETSFKEKLKDKITMTCDRIDYNYGDKTGTAEGSVKVVQEEATPEGYKVHSTAYGDKADYNGKDEILVVTGRVKIEQKDGEWLNAQKATISLKEDWVEIEGNIEGNFKIEEEKIPDTKF